MKLSLIITTYNWPEALLLVLESIKRQTIVPFEVIIADDGSTNETRNLINNFNQKSNFNIVHSWHEDLGFRAAKARNKAISKATGDYIILIDGDSILHTNFLKDHIFHSEPGYFIQGSRVLMTSGETQKVLQNKKIYFSFFSSKFKNKKNAIYSRFLSKIFLRKENHLRGIRSCNLAFYKQDCININGFNNNFEGWGREDSEFIVRLINSGINRKNIRFNAIQFHLWHNENPRKNLELNDAILQETISKSIKWCEDGINSIKTNES